MAAHRVAVLSVHSHGDRSFLDDRNLALLSGELSARGVDNDLVVAVLDPRCEENPDGNTVLARTVEVLSAYDVVVYERVWSAGLIAALRARLPNKTFIACEGEHRLDDAPADYVCRGDLGAGVASVLEVLRGERTAPLAGTAVRGPDGLTLVPGTPSPPAPSSSERFAPNLSPIVVNPEQRPPLRTFAVLGNAGCPYQADARDNPLYRGVAMPDGIGRGCAFCTTGNRYDGAPSEQTAKRVFEQLRALRGAESGIEHVVLKDQNPFAYLETLIERAIDARVPPFTLMLETRADWFLRAAPKFEAALTLAQGAGHRLAPYLVGIENFSQAELDRMNKGIDAATNVEFLLALRRWKERFGRALDLDQAAFGFVLFTPWTTFDDLQLNLRGIEQTRFHELRGKILQSRARLYPDTALYYLAQRDGLLSDAHARSGDDASRRYGYFPAHPWRFADPRVGALAALASELSDQTGGRDELSLFHGLLAAFEDESAAPTAESVLALAEARQPGGAGAASASASVHARLRRLLAPLDLDAGFESGWRLGELTTDTGRLRVELVHEHEAPLLLDIAPRGTTPYYARSRHYHLSYRNSALSDAQRRALEVLARALSQGDR